MYMFHCIVFKTGKIRIDVIVNENKYTLLRSILLNFNSVHELKWIREEINKEFKKEGKTYTGQNTLKIGLINDKVELSHNYDPNHVQIIPIKIIFDFIEDCINFFQFYHSGGIPGLIPSSKKDDWSIVPNQFVKEEYWDRDT